MFRLQHIYKYARNSHRRYSLTSTTHTSLSATFNQRPTRKVNLSITKEDTGLFGWSTLQSPDGFYILEEQCRYKTKELIKEAQSDTRQRKMVEIFDEMSDTLCKVADLAEFIRLAHPRAAFTDAAEYACVKISGIVESLNTHVKLYNVLKEVYEKGDKFETTEMDRHVTQLFLFDFEQSGIHLEEKLRRQVVELNDYILQVGQKFVAGAIAPRSVNRHIIPEPLQYLFPTDSNNIHIAGLYADSNNQMAREIGYKLFLQPDTNQEFLLDEMLAARYKLAQTCGFPTYSHRAVKASIVETPEFVQEFLDLLNNDLRSRAQEDFSSMNRMKMRESPNSGRLACWDVPYFNHKLKKELLKADTNEFAPYFPLGNCMEGLNMLLNSLFGISLVNEETTPGELWAPDVYKLAVKHETEGLLGYIYCDFYERENKPNQDCHYTIQGGKLLSNGEYQNPIVVVMLNIPPPRWSTPSLLTPNLVDNLFHEMGHAMHSMLARTKYQHVTGTRCCTDFAEVPSILLEYFASDPRVLRQFARHFQTQEQIPEDMLQRMTSSKHLFIASETEIQLFYSALDHRYHSTKPVPKTTTEVLKQLQKQYYSLPYVENTAWQLRFSHLVGYGAKYYSYLISRAVASWIWQQYFEKNPFCRTSGEKYRRECLAHGGGKPPRNLVSELLQKECTPQSLAVALISEIDRKRDDLKHVVKLKK